MGVLRVVADDEGGLRAWRVGDDGAATPLDLGPASLAAEAQVRNEYPRLVRDAPAMPAGGSVLDRLRRPDGPNLWWYAPAAEKGPQRTPLPLQLFRLALVRRLHAQAAAGRVELDLGDPDLEETVRAALAAQGVAVEAAGRGRRARPGSALARAAKVIAKTLGNRLVLRAAGIRRSGDRADALLFTRWPVLWRHGWSRRAEERYFGKADGALRGRMGVRYLATVTEWPWTVWRGRRGAREAVESAGVELVPLHATLRDALAVAWASLAASARPRPRLPEVRFDGWDVTRLWAAEVSRSLAAHDLPDNLLLERAVRRAVRRLGAKAVLAPLEFQPMERAVWHAAASAGASVVAVQSIVFSPNDYMFLHPEGALRPREGSDAPPLPDLVAASGAAAARLLGEAGYPPDRVALVGATRYDDLRVEPPEVDAARRARLGVRPGERAILLTTTADRAESIRLLEAAWAAFRDLPGPFALVLKCHYHCRLEERALGMASRLPEGARLVVADVNDAVRELVKACDGVVDGGTAVALEALALGRKPIVWSEAGRPSLNPLLAHPSAFHDARGVEALRESALRVLGGEALDGSWEAARRAALHDAFGALDGKAGARMADLVEDAIRRGAEAGAP
ncbi:MAG TPA: hypothetical protein VHH36_05060 [Candidatus Thermoplasmatota archaeon]|nr:hypothetical protein [Candidatus Thermoplasmatota archaeon]